MSKVEHDYFGYIFDSIGKDCFYQTPATADDRTLSVCPSVVVIFLIATFITYTNAHMHTYGVYKLFKV